MLCQNCKRNDAAVHLKRIINGEAAEIHLCGMCASAFGAADSVMGFSPFGDLFGTVLTSSATGRISNKVIRCETCGFSFDDIAKTGFPGCPDCYRVFSQKMRPMIQKLHGRAVYKGKTASAPVTGEAFQDEPLQEIEALREKLQRAVEEQNFELAAVLRDEILALTAKEGQ